MPVVRRQFTDLLTLESFVPGGALNNTNDAQPGLLQASVSGMIMQGAKQGQVGAIIALDEADALKLSYTATGTLHAGLYMYCQFYLSSSATVAVGNVVFWQNFASVIVTPDVTAATDGQIAGVGLQTITKGNYGWVQVAGRAGIKFKATCSKATPVAGDLVIVDQTPAALGDVPLDNATWTPLIGKGILGVLYDDTAPVGGAVRLVDLE